MKKRIEIEQKQLDDEAQARLEAWRKRQEDLWRLGRRWPQYRALIESGELDADEKTLALLARAADSDAPARVVEH